MAEQECHEEVSRRGELQPCDKVAVAMRFDPTFGDPYPVCAFHARGANMMSLSAVEAAVRADMQREVQAVEWGTAEIDKDGDLFDCWANPSRESAMKDLAGADKDVPMVLVQRTAAVPAGPWLLVAPSTPNQQGAEQ